MTYGLVVLGLTKIGLYPRPRPEDLSISPAQLLTNIRHIECHSKSSENHTCGGDELQAGLKEVWRSFERNFEFSLEELAKSARTAES